MELLSSAHLAALLATLAAGAAAAWLPRARGERAALVGARALALAVAAAYLADHAIAALRGDWTVRQYLPFNLTDAATIVAAAALWTARPALVELTYLWGLTASLQALLTPELGHDFPDPLFVTFFVVHGGVVVAALLLVVGIGIAPRPGAVWRAFAATAAVAAAAAAATLATGGNYMFLRRKPAGGSLLDLLGPWPWYIAAAGALAPALFWVLCAPFRARAR